MATQLSTIVTNSMPIEILSLTNGAALNTPASGNFSTGTFTWPTFNQNTSGLAAGLSIILPITGGGTGAITKADAQINLLPTQTGAHAGKQLTTDGTNVSWKPSTQARAVTIASSTSLVIDSDTTDVAIQANTQGAGTLSISVTGSPVEAQKLIIRLKSTNVQTLSWNAVFTDISGVPLPTASSGSSKTDYFGFIYNATSSKWQLLAKVLGFA